MVNDLKSTLWITGALNTRLVGVLGLIFNEICMDFENPMEIEFVFEMLNVTIVGGADGSTIKLEKSKIKSVSMGECGDLVVENLASWSVFPTIVGKILSDISLIKSNGENFVGIRFGFGADRLSIVHLGDELYYFLEVPTEIAEYNKLTYHEIIEKPAGGL